MDINSKHTEILKDWSLLATLIDEFPFKEHSELKFKCYDSLERLKKNATLGIVCTELVDTVNALNQSEN